MRADRIIQQVAANANLDRVGRLLGLDGHVNRRGIGAWGVVAPRTMCDTVEAILGAVYVDGGVGAVRLVMGRLGLVPS